MKTLARISLVALLAGFGGCAIDDTTESLGLREGHADIAPVAHYKAPGQEVAATVNISNRSGRALEISVSPADRPASTLASGATATLSRVSPDTFVSIYNAVTGAAEEDSWLRYEVRADQRSHVVSVTVLDSDDPGNGSVHLHENGGVFVY